LTPPVASRIQLTKLVRALKDRNKTHEVAQQSYQAPFDAIFRTLGDAVTVPHGAGRDT